jgi:dsDNA-binding SOS-regulon protein
MKPHTFTSDGGTLEVAHQDLLDLRALADERSSPGAPVGVSDVVAEALDAFLAGQRTNLHKITEQAAQDERERVEAEHGAVA